MKFGVFGVNMGPCSTPDTAARMTQAGLGAPAGGLEFLRATALAYLLVRVGRRLAR